jgi:hypothetical protein
VSFKKASSLKLTRNSRVKLSLAVITSHKSMRAGIPTFQKSVKRPHRIYKHQDIAPILDYLSQAELPREAIAKLNEDSGISQSDNEKAAC